MAESAQMKKDEIMNKASETCQEGQQQAGGLMQQMRSISQGAADQMRSISQGAADAVKNAMGMGNTNSSTTNTDPTMK